MPTKIAFNARRNVQKIVEAKRKEGDDMPPFKPRQTKEDHQSAGDRPRTRAGEAEGKRINEQKLDCRQEEFVNKIHGRHRNTKPFPRIRLHHFYAPLEKLRSMVFVLI